MSFFCKNAAEEALKEIARQMRIDNTYKVLRALYEVGNISKEEYVKQLRKLYEYA